MPNIDVKEAVRLAKEFAQKIYENEEISRLGLEALERTEDGKNWLVTLGFTRAWNFPKPSRTQTPLDQTLMALRKPKIERDYKVFQIDVQSGDVVSMKIFDTKGLQSWREE